MKEIKDIIKEELDKLIFNSLELVDVGSCLVMPNRHIRKDIVEDYTNNIISKLGLMEVASGEVQPEDDWGGRLSFIDEKENGIVKYTYIDSYFNKNIGQNITIYIRKNE